VNFVCASHPQADAIARCTRCGVHLCASCRTLDGLRNICGGCRDSLRAVAAAAGPVAIAVDTTAAPRCERSAWLAATLSLIPGLGQAYAGRVLRGGALFAAAMALRDAPFMTPLLGSYLYAFVLFDAFRCAESRTAGAAATRGRLDDGFVLAAGLAVIVVTLAAAGGFAAAPREVLVPLGGLAAALLFAHETRR
jgi:hypothetical protein